MKQIFTIGHSTRTLEDFIDLLKAYEIELLLDVRTIPKSKHNPQFNEENLKEALHKNRIKYLHLTKLGGLRHALKNSINTGWKNLSFRGFADYMQTSLFWEGLVELETLTQQHSKVAIMCAEAVPWRCHRSLIADALTVRRWKVFHIQSTKTAKQHKVTSFLHVHKSGELVYG
jgi:uncharacterized protein (DUF488 family)